jgi:hypothetical protein
MRLLVALAFAAMLHCFGAVPGHTEKGVMLVTGNTDNQCADQLAYALANARRMREEPQALGLEIVGASPSCDASVRLCDSNPPVGGGCPFTMRHLLRGKQRSVADRRDGRGSA